MKRVPIAVWILIAILVVVAVVAWLGYDHWGPIEPT
jgi:hypothetical protein